MAAPVYFNSWQNIVCLNAFKGLQITQRVCHPGLVFARIFNYWKNRWKTTFEEITWSRLLSYLEL